MYCQGIIYYFVAALLAILETTLAESGATPGAESSGAVSSTVFSGSAK